jgi:hypothetical protein
MYQDLAVEEGKGMCFVWLALTLALMAWTVSLWRPFGN